VSVAKPRNESCLCHCSILIGAATRNPPSSRSKQPRLSRGPVVTIWAPGGELISAAARAFTPRSLRGAAERATGAQLRGTGFVCSGRCRRPPGRRPPSNCSLLPAALSRYAANTEASGNRVFSRARTSTCARRARRGKRAGHNVPLILHGVINSMLGVWAAARASHGSHRGEAPARSVLRMP